MSTKANRPIPDNEAQRVRALRAHETLDTPPEIEFDAHTRVASHTFGSPIALVVLMDSDRLRFKSRLGVDLPEAARKVAFCAHAILRSKVRAGETLARLGGDEFAAPARAAKGRLRHR